MTDTPESQAAPSQRYWLRLMVLALFLPPVGYAGTLLAVVVHEVVGHGGAAICLGGKLRGFEIHWDGMGWARTDLPPQASLQDQAVHLAAGAGSTTLFGGAFLAIAFWRRKAVFLPMALAVLSSAFVLDGSIYMFWSAYLPNPPGDFARIIFMTGSEELRWTFLGLGLILTVAFTLIPMRILVRASHRWLPVTTSSGRIRRAILPVLIGAAFALGQVAFDWNQLVGGIGDLPRIVGIFVGAATGLALDRVKPQDLEEPIPLGRAVLPLVIVWTSTAIVLVVMGRWLIHGVGD